MFHRKTNHNYCQFFLLPMALLLFLFGCDIYGTVGGDDINLPGGLPLQLVGEWAFASVEKSEGYSITSTEIQYHDGAGGGTFSYTGNIRFVSNFDASSGVIIIEYTDPPTYSGYNENTFFAIYYRNLKPSTMQMANTTILPANTCPDTATLEEAVGKFTRMKMGNYVNWSIVQSQGRIN